MKTVLFVCTGNTMRSMLAEYLFQKFLKEQQDTQFSVSSAGTRGNPLGPYPQTLALLHAKGIDASSHVPRVLSKELIAASDFIICMAKHHQQYIKDHFDTESLLFNNITLHETTDIQDDDEAQIWPGDPRFPSFLAHLCQTLEERLPALYTYLQA